MTTSGSDQESPSIQSTLQQPLILFDKAHQRTHERGYPFWLRRIILPIAILLIAVCLVFVGIFCENARRIRFAECQPILISTGVILPEVALVLVIFCNIPSAAKRSQEDFYSDALLEEILSSDNGGCTFAISENGNLKDGLVVFFVGIGSIPEVNIHQVKAINEAGYCAMIIQLPGSGVLRAVRFSLPRAEKVVLNAFRHVERLLNNDIEAQDSIDDIELEESEDISEFTTFPHILVAWGLGSHVAMYMASQRRLGSRGLKGIVLYGSALIPQSIGFLKHMQYASYRIYFISLFVRWRQYAALSPDVRKVVDIEDLNPEARADWADDFNDWYLGLRSSCSYYDGHVLCISKDSTYLKGMQRLWSRANENNKLQTIHLRNIAPVGSSFFFTRRSDRHAKYLVDFVNDQFLSHGIDDE